MQQFLFFNTGLTAQLLKTKISPAFTPSKLKNMFYLMLESFERFDDYLEGLLLKDDCINCNDLTERFTADIFNRCFLGININTLTKETNEDNKFIEYSQKLRGANWRGTVRSVMIDIIPQLYNLFGYYILDNAKITQFYTDLMINIMEQRKKHGISKHDFISILIEMKENPGKLAEITGKNSLLIIMY